VGSPRYELRPIGTVRSQNGAYRIEIDEPFRPALEGLAGFSHVLVIFWCHSVDTPEHRQTLTCDQPYTKGPAKLGILATRSPVRPNPLGVTPTAVLKLDVEGGSILASFLDAEDGTPVLDIKPYQPSIDRVRNSRSPDWCAHWPQWLEDSAAFDWASEFSCD